MSVVERYSDQDRSVHFGRAPWDVITARIRAMQRMKSATEFHLKRQINVGSVAPDLHENYRSALKL